MSLTASFHGVSAAHVTVGADGGAIFGFADAQVHAAGDTDADRLTEMAAIGRAITEQAEAHLSDLADTLDMSANCLEATGGCSHKADAMRDEAEAIRPESACLNPGECDHHLEPAVLGP